MIFPVFVFVLFSELNSIYSKMFPPALSSVGWSRMSNQPSPYTLNELLQQKYSDDYSTSLLVTDGDYGIPNRAL